MIRKRRKSDERAVMELYRCLWDESITWFPNRLQNQFSFEDYQEYYESLGTDQNIVTAVYEDENKRIVGVASIKKSPLTAIISDVVVASDKRRNGIGTSLIRWLEEEAFQFGCLFIDVEVALNNTAREFYTKTGYEPVVVKMRKMCQDMYSL